MAWARPAEAPLRRHRVPLRADGVARNVVFLLLGMMIIVSVLERAGGFEYLASWVARRSGGLPFRLMVLLVVSTAFVFALLGDASAYVWLRYHAFVR